MNTSKAFAIHKRNLKSAARQLRTIKERILLIDRSLVSLGDLGERVQSAIAGIEEKLDQLKTKTMNLTTDSKKELGEALADAASAVFTEKTGRKISSITDDRGDFPISYSALSNMKNGTFSEHTMWTIVEYIGNAELRVSYTLTIPQNEKAKA